MERPLCSPYHSYRCQGQRDWTLGSLQSRVAITCGKPHQKNRKKHKQNGRRVLFETETRPPGGLLILLLMAALIDPGVLRSPGNSVTGRLLSCSMRLWPKGNLPWGRTPEEIPTIWAMGSCWDREKTQLRGVLRMPGQTCGSMGSYYCRSWSCVTSCDGPWEWDVGNRDLVAPSVAQSAGPSTSDMGAI